MSMLDDWLTSIGLSQYAEPFAANEIDFAVLPELTDEDLRELQIPLGHRRKLLRAIREIPDGKPPLASVLDDHAQRRYVTVMFCDLVGSTALSARFDAEDVRNILLAYQECLSQTLAEHDGTIARYMGDGALVYFGYPQAHEDDAVRSIQAALAIVARVPAIETGFDVRLQVRVGIATGHVVIGDILNAENGRERAVVGETPNLAARLQSAAAPNSVAVCANTHRLAADYFTYKEFGGLQLKGWSAPVTAWQPLQTTGVSSRSEAARGVSTTPLLGREEEIELVLRRWHTATEGNGKAVVLTGESGIGKSHVTLAIEHAIESQPHYVLSYFCSPHHTNSALFPFAVELERAANILRTDSDAERRAKLEAQLAIDLPSEEFAAALLGGMISISVPAAPVPFGLTPQQQKDKTLLLLKERLFRLAKKRPLLLIFEDAQWADPSSLDLLASLIEDVANHPILLIVTARPEFVVPWPNHPHITQLALSRLPAGVAAAIVGQVLGGKQLPTPVLERILSQADGIPLFIEELTKTVLESGQLEETENTFVAGRPASSLAIPSSLSASLTARLDRLGAARELAQVGAVIGREFSFELIGAIAEVSPAVLDEALGQVVKAGLMFQRGTPPEAVYSFKHALVREAAYSSLLKSRRMQLHAALGRALVEKFFGIIASQPELVAYHFSEGGIADQAIRFWLEAGRRAAGQSANREAIAHLQSGLAQLNTISSGPQRDRQELEFLMILGPCLIAVQGPAGSEAAALFARAKATCERIGSAPEYLQVLFWSATAGVMRGELASARKNIEALIDTAIARGDRAALLNAMRGNAMIMMFMGHIVEAQRAIERAYCAYQESGGADRLAARAAGQDAGVADLSLMSWTYWFAGRADTSLQRIQEALELADAIAHPLSRAYAAYYAAVLHALRAEPKEARSQAEHCIALADEHGFGQWRELARTVKGAMDAFIEGPLALDLTRTALEQYRKAGYQLGMTTVHVLLGHALLQHREFQHAEEAAQAGLAIAEKNEERLFEAELYRLLALARSGLDGTDPAEPIDLLCRAFQVAQKQGARTLLLRVACDLAEQHLRNGHPSEAKAAFGSAFQELSEGGDTSDIRRAQAIQRCLNCA